MFQYRAWHGDRAGIQGLAMAHPLYIMLAKAFAWLPLGPYAFRVNLFSGVCAAVALGLMADLLNTLTRSKFAAICGVMLLGVSHTFWMHAVIAEVYSLYAVALLAELWLIQRYFATRKAGWLIAALFVNGLNLSNHLLAILHWPAYAVVVGAALRKKTLTPRMLPTLALAVLIGASHYLALIAASIWGGQPVLAAMKESIVGPPSRAGVVLAHSFSVVQLLTRSLQFFVLNFPTPLAVLAPVGLWAACKRVETRGIALFSAGIFGVGYVFAFRYLVPDQFVFYYPCYVMFALFAALGIPTVARSRAARAVCLVLALLPAGVYEVAPKIARDRGLALGFNRQIPYRENYSYFLQPRKNGDGGAERFAREALQTASPDGLLIGDSTIQNAVSYARDVLGVCPDVTLNLAGDVLPASPSLRTDAESIRPFVARGAAYACTNAPDYLSKWLTDDYDLVPVGVVYRIVEKGAARR